MLRFLHAADPHIDSPLKNLHTYEGFPPERFGSLTRTSFEKMITLAIEQEVAFVLIAGDLFDGPWDDMSTGLWTASQFRRLENAKISVFLVRGNHDAANRVHEVIPWPENVHVFSPDAAETILLEEAAVAIHGRSFAKRDEKQDLATTYPHRVEGCLNIGLLHTSLSGSAQHDTYAPCDLETLLRKGYDYWALGHIHKREVVHDSPPVVYSGNLQGLHINEPGAKGVYLVTADSQGVREYDFRPTDALRWFSETIVLSAEEDREELEEAFAKRCEAIETDLQGRWGVLRLTVSGRTPLQAKVSDLQGREELVGRLKNVMNRTASNLLLEGVRFSTSRPIDREALLAGDDLAGNLLRDVLHFRKALSDENDSGEEKRLLTELLGSLARHVEIREAGIRLEDSHQLLHWLEDAENLLLEGLPETPT